jgi:hypothetical protein
MLGSKVMTLDQQVTSLALSKRLKELGASQTSLFYWAESGRGDTTPWIVGPNAVDIPDASFYSAFTVAELGVMLPYCFVSERRASGRWECGQHYRLEVEGNGPAHPFTDVSDVFFADTEVEVRAKMLVLVLERPPTKASIGTD